MSNKVGILSQCWFVQGFSKSTQLVALESYLLAGTIARLSQSPLGLLNSALPERYDYGMLCHRTDVVAPLAGARHLVPELAY
jgi:hypothetical protein